MRNEVIHDTERNQFYLEFERKRALMDYRKISDTILEYHRTYVPRALRKQGLASLVVHKALEYARENGFKVIPACSFVKQFIETHKGFEDLVEGSE
ncbi:MAG: GNAT family N-acetyltransferase [Candidatus Stygibacter frigidus]|nr:GNAT family N-acetyltransferase [Candidatus Stygibacter frigidus]